jgi:hypothetical protein
VSPRGLLWLLQLLFQCPFQFQRPSARHIRASRR